ncbi:hypothetical protein CONPUDRAFT_160366 [Coniophora puteana RWD-64-598 SS2]|uniref:Uncharacterized protein n=1 Tax=Coniophora puteana (strain RWD-64-598) TaxID=741705 RepID=R7SD71_CONPW|nr:uncharacterized protein CONPUDRAFT_160366 [Coniophora puteana RWD-64-598 SS2]EIW74113.1 hypothetical protein CONPUDRAFT_160366 [Coniophora puteana RWD-64-598 SS2]
MAFRDDRGEQSPPKGKMGGLSPCTVVKLVVVLDWCFVVVYGHPIFWDIDVLTVAVVVAARA